MTDQGSSDVLLVTDEEHVRTLTFNRPAVKNAFDLALWRAAGAALAAAADDDAVSVVVLTGAGDAFSAGVDVASLADESRRAENKPAFDAFLETLIAFPKPLLAAVNGVAVGVGMTMLAHCDLVLVSTAARLRAPFAKLGVVPEAGSSVALPMRIGWQHAAHLFFTAAWLDAHDALARGLAWRVCEPGALLPETAAVAREIAAMPLVSLVETKRLMLAGRVDAVRAARARESEAFNTLLGAR
jgi:enoyl-CoA hydratase/carnithine racemase